MVRLAAIAVLLSLLAFALVCLPADAGAAVLHGDPTAPPPGVAFAGADAGGASIPMVKEGGMHGRGRVPARSAHSAGAGSEAGKAARSSGVKDASGQAVGGSTGEAGSAQVASGAVKGRSFTNGIGLKMVWVKSGAFDMGARPGDELRCSGEGPLHKVKIRQGFWMSAIEVRQDMFETLCGFNPSRHKRGDWPVTNVLYDEALDFCHKLSLAESRAGRLPGGYEYTLPTEAQWEYACRAGRKDEPGEKLEERCWYADSCLLGGDPWQVRTHSGGLKKPNPLGLYDMLGNVWEWCQDDYHPCYEGAPSDERPWLDTDLPEKVIRGGSFQSAPRHCRAAFRTSRSPTFRSPTQGFRIVLASTRSILSAPLAAEDITAVVGGGKRTAERAGYEGGGIRPSPEEERLLAGVLGLGSQAAGRTGAGTSSKGRERPSREGAVGTLGRRGNGEAPDSPADAVEVGNAGGRDDARRSVSGSAEGNDEAAGGSSRRDGKGDGTAGKSSDERLRSSVKPPVPAFSMRVNSLGIRMIYIPAGRFHMTGVQAKPVALDGGGKGKTRAGHGRRGRGRHRKKGSTGGSDRLAWTSGGPGARLELAGCDSSGRDVTIRKGFWMSATEITQEQYRKIMSANPSHFKGDDRPVENVSWEQAMEFCRRLSEVEDKRYRLPTEAQWEYACRAGRGALSSSDAVETAWCAENSAGRTHEVASKKANDWGLFDMPGNVKEWCADIYGLLPGFVCASASVASRGQRVVRGASWKSSTADLAFGARSLHGPDVRFSTVGFRVVCLDR